MAQGFNSLDPQLGLPAGFGGDCVLVRIEFGRHTGWALIAECDCAGEIRWIVADDPVSYRVHDEHEIQSYWEARAAESAPIAFAYEIEQSAYLDELRQGVSGLMRAPLRHFLFCGADTCLEVIESEPPRLAAQDLSRA